MDNSMQPHRCQPQAPARGRPLGIQENTAHFVPSQAAEVDAAGSQACSAGNQADGASTAASTWDMASAASAPIQPCDHAGSSHITSTHPPGAQTCAASPAYQPSCCCHIRCFRAEDGSCFKTLPRTTRLPGVGAVDQAQDCQQDNIGMRCVVQNIPAALNAALCDLRTFGFLPTFGMRCAAQLDATLNSGSEPHLRAPYPWGRQSLLRSMMDACC